MKAVVIGGGLGGLATALRLRTQGWEVTVCEAGASLGGKMNRLRTCGYCFDTGPSLITMPDVFADVYRAAGEDMAEHLSLIRLDPHAEYRFADGASLICPAGTDEWRDVIRGIEPRDVAGFDKLHVLGRKLYELSRRSFFQRSPYSRPRLSELSALRYLPPLTAWGKYASVIAHFLRNPYLQQIYNRYPTYVGSSPYLCPATLLIIPFLEREFGAWYVRGGLYEVVESLMRLLRARGVELRCDCRVSEIESRGERVKGVRFPDGSHLKADVVVMNGDVVASASLLAGSVPAEIQRPQLRSLSGFVIMAGVASRPANLGHHTVIFSRNYRMEFDDLFVRRRFPAEPTVYVSAPAATDSSVAPEGGDALFVMANAPATGETWEQRDIDAASESILDIMARNGLALTRKSICDVFDPGRFARCYLAPGGAIYGTHSHGWRRAFFRPPNRSTRVRGLYFVGGSTHPGGGTPTVLMSARIVAKMIESDARA